jgi:hypothetical protein
LYIPNCFQEKQGYRPENSYFFSFSPSWLRKWARNIYCLILSKF